MLSSFYLPLVLLAAIVGTALSLFAWLHRESPGAGPLSLFLFVVSLLAIVEGLSLVTPGVGTVYWATLGYAITSLVPLAWFLTVLEYTGREHWLSLPTGAVLLVEPVLYSLLLWTNDSHQLVWTDAETVFVDPYTAFVASEGIAFWGHLAYVYLLVAIGAAILLRVLWRSDGVFRAQSTALLAAIAVPMIINALYAFGMLGLSVNPTGITFVLSGAVLTVAILRGQLLAVAPAAREIGREELVADMEDPVIIIDAGGAVVDANPAAERLLGTDRFGAVGTPLADLQPDLAAAVGSSEDQDEVSLDDDGVTRVFDVRISPFTRAYGAVTGSIVSLRDVTERTRREQRLDVMNRLFRHNLRNEMNVVRGNAELLRDGVEDEGLRRRAQRVLDTVDEVVGRSDKVGSLSRSLDEETFGRTVDIETALHGAVSKVRNDHPEVEVDLVVPEGSWLVIAGPSIEIAIGELLDNAATHSQGTATISATLSRAADTVVIEIADKGPGIPRQELAPIEAGAETPLQHGSGIGLWLATWVVERSGGQIDFAVEEGTTVTITLSAAETD